MSNNTPDYENNLAFEPVKIAEAMATIARDSKTVAIRCFVDNEHYFDLALEDAPKKMNWFDAKIWCEEHYCRLPMKHELEFIGKNLKAINRMLKLVGGQPLKNDWYWSSSEYNNYNAWNSYLNYSYGLGNGNKNGHNYVRPVLAL